ncbi:Esterase [Ilyonectria robusta]
MYIHGGGFVSGSPISVSSYLLQLHLELRDRGLHADVIAVEYDLAPECPYPHALQQIASAYEHIQAQCKPIVLMGDSAGGNLCLALLRHLAHPHPQISSPRLSPNSSQGIVALCLASPWVDLRKNSIFCHGISSDCLDRSALDSWRDAYLGGQPVSEYASPLGFPTSTGWKEILPPKALFMSGELDLFLAQIKSLGEEIKKDPQDGYQGLDITIEPLKGHVWNLVDYGGAIPGDSQGKEIERMEALRGVCLQADWISEHCNP